MKRIFFYCFVAVVVSAALPAASRAAPVPLESGRILLNGEWKLEVAQPGGEKLFDNFYEPGFDDAGMRTIQVPLNWEMAGFEGLEEMLPVFAENAKRNFLKLVEAGVPFLAGTDAGLPGVFPGASLHRELELLAELGLPLEQVLRSATSSPFGIASGAYP